MSRGFGGTAFEPVEEGRDKEITLGPMMMAVLGLVLLGVCSLCFLGGYAVGRRGPALAAPAAAKGPSAADLFRDQPKPAATQSNDAAPSAAQAAAAAPAGTTDSEATSSTTETPVSYTTSSANPTPAVHTALPAQAASAPPASSGAPVQSALPPAGSWMVQIAAVSHSEDADVLMTALRQRGYAVSQRRDPVDNLIHVQVGPFSTENDAIAMRQRLLNDGYNAVIQP